MLHLGSHLRVGILLFASSVCQALYPLERFSDLWLVIRIERVKRHNTVFFEDFVEWFPAQTGASEHLVNGYTSLFPRLIAAPPSSLWS